MSFFHAGQGFGGPGKGKPVLDMRLDLSRNHELRNFSQLVAVGLDGISSGANAKLLCFFLRRLGQRGNQDSTLIWDV